MHYLLPICGRGSYKQYNYKLKGKYLQLKLHICKTTENERTKRVLRNENIIVRGEIIVILLKVSHLRAKWNEKTTFFPNMSLMDNTLISFMFCIQP